MGTYEIIYQKHKRGKHLSHQGIFPRDLDAWKYGLQEYKQVVSITEITQDQPGQPVTTRDVPRPVHCPEEDCDWIGIEEHMPIHTERDHPEALEDQGESEEKS